MSISISARKEPVSGDAVGVRRSTIPASTGASLDCSEEVLLVLDRARSVILSPFSTDERRVVQYPSICLVLLGVKGGWKRMMALSWRMVVMCKEAIWGMRWECWEGV